MRLRLRPQFRSLQSLVLTLPALFLVGTASQASSAATACSASKLQEVREHASSGNTQVVVDCNLTLTATDVISKALVFYGPESSGVKLNCNGALIDGTATGSSTGANMILIRPRRAGSAWLPPDGVTISGCKIKGSARILWGDHFNSGVLLPGGAKDYEIYDSSRRADHTAHMQAYAPKRIHFSKMTFQGVGGGNMLYFGPGVTDSSVVDSQFLGATEAAAIYLESESARITIKNNVFNVASAARELISVDASAKNTIINNKFSKLQYGGIFLYRNCGEQGVIRHLAPDNNVIVNNVFDYSTTPSVVANKYGVFVSSRTGLERLGKPNDYCPEDQGYPYGSSADDRSPARNNIVAQNRFIGKNVADALVIANGWPNIERVNEKVTSAPSRLAGCYVKNGSPKDFILHGQSVNAFLVNGQATCTGTKVTCADGVTSTSSFTCPVAPKNICKIEINTSNRLVIRDGSGGGLFYFGFDQVAQANSKLQDLIRDKTCDSTSRGYVAQKCEVQLNGAGRYVVRLASSGQGLFYFSTKKEADVKYSQLRTQKICL